MKVQQVILYIENHWCPSKFNRFLPLVSMTCFRKRLVLKRFLPTVEMTCLRKHLDLKRFLPSVEMTMAAEGGWGWGRWAQSAHLPHPIQRSMLCHFDQKTQRSKFCREKSIL